MTQEGKGEPKYRRLKSKEYPKIGDLAFFPRGPEVIKTKRLANALFLMGCRAVLRKVKRLPRPDGGRKVG